MVCGQQSKFFVSGADDDVFEISQGEGGEQGDAFMPALFNLGLNLALRNERSSLELGETDFLFLDDVYLLIERDRVRAMLDHFSRAIFNFTRVRTNLGKIRCWGCGDTAAPVGVAELGPEVWCGNKPQAQRGLIMLGSPIGPVEFAEAWCQHMATRHNHLLSTLPLISKAQCR